MQAWVYPRNKLTYLKDISQGQYAKIMLMEAQVSYLFTAWLYDTMIIPYSNKHQQACTEMYVSTYITSTVLASMLLCMYVAGIAQKCLFLSLCMYVRSYTLSAA